MDKGIACIMGELEFETGNIKIKVEREGELIGHMILIATIIKDISNEMGFSTTKIMKDIMNVLEGSEWVVNGKKNEE